MGNRMVAPSKGEPVTPHQEATESQEIGQNFMGNLQRSLLWILKFTDSVHLASVDRAARGRRRARRGLTASSVRGGGWQTLLYVLKRWRELSIFSLPLNNT
jgi:hypothetical protein